MRGRKLLYSFTFSGRSVEIYPREGTETTQLYNQLHNWGLKFIPVRGRKLFFDFLRTVEFVEIYPREGTETSGRLNEIENIKVEIYPREGTETSFHLELIFLGTT